MIYNHSECCIIGSALSQNNSMLSSSCLNIYYGQFKGVLNPISGAVYMLIDFTQVCWDALSTNLPILNYHHSSNINQIELKLHLPVTIPLLWLETKLVTKKPELNFPYWFFFVIVNPIRINNLILYNEVISGSLLWNSEISIHSAVLEFCEGPWISLGYRFPST